MKRRATLASNTEWRVWGRVDPLWGVAAKEGRRREDASPWTDIDFYELGAADWEVYRRHWEQYGMDPEACLEIGCGAGRMTRQLAACFRRVHGVDVSEEMVAYARERLGAGNVDFHVTDGASLPLADRSVTAVFSTLVFRHFDSTEDGAAYFREIARVLRPGGTMLIELPVHVWPSPNPLFEAAFRLEKTLGTLRATYRRAMLERGRGRPFFRRRTYEIGWLRETLGALGFASVTVSQIELPAIGDRHWCVLARRS